MEVTVTEEMLKNNTVYLNIMAIDYIGFAFAATVAAGGIMGYVKAQSVPSLAAGVGFGVLLAVGAYQTTQDSHNYILSLGLSTLLVGIMGFRCLATGKFMPAGVVALLSLLNVFRLCTRYVFVADDR